MLALLLRRILAAGTNQAIISATPSEGSHEKTEVRLDIKRGAVTVGIVWPQTALGDLAGFMRELLK